MKKIISLTLLVFLGIHSICSQNDPANKANSSMKKDSTSRIIARAEPQPEDVYVIFTSKEYDPENENGITEGVRRITFFDPNLHDSPAISYKFLSKSKGFEIEFWHRDSKVEHLEKIRPVTPKDKMSTVVLPKTFLSQIDPTDLDKQGPSMSKKKALALRKSLLGKIIWVIDRRNSTKDPVKLIQTEATLPPVAFDKVYAL